LPLRVHDNGGVDRHSFGRRRRALLPATVGWVPMIESSASALSASVSETMMRDLIAAIDLGSNSFRLQVGRIVNDQIYPLDGLKEAVRLAAGLSPDKKLDLASQQRGVAALQRFHERLRDFPPRARACGGNQYPAGGEERTRVPDPR